MHSQWKNKTSSSPEMGVKKNSPEVKAQRKISQTNEYAKNVVRRNASERQYLEKITKHIDKEKASKETQLNYAQRLLLRRYGLQKDSGEFESGPEMLAKNKDFACVKQKFLSYPNPQDPHTGRFRSSSWGPSTTTFDSQRSSIQSIEHAGFQSKANFSPKLSFKRAERTKRVPEVTLHSCESQEKSNNSVGRSFDESTVTRKISEVLPPFVLPPIHTSVPGNSHAHKRNCKRVKHVDHVRLCSSFSDPGRQNPKRCPVNSNRENIHQQQDLSDCRYLRPRVNQKDTNTDDF